MTGVALLLAQAVFYFAIMGVLFRARHQLGIGVFVCALGVMHFVETYLAAVFFIRLPFGLISPGSTVLFAGKLAMILLLYIKEDAETVRQPIYGLLIGNLTMVFLVFILRISPSPEVLAGYNPDLGLLDQIGTLMVWGTVLLFVDSIALIVIFEKLKSVFEAAVVPRVLSALLLVLTFDQIAFFAGLHFVSATPTTALFGGWVAKMAAAGIYSAMIGIYLHWIDRLPEGSHQAEAGGVFDKLTYRHRYEDLLQKSGLDPLTGALNRGRFDDAARSSMANALATGRPLSLAILDVDHFKQINDRYGHVMGDDVLRRIAQALHGALRENDKIFRYGGEEFVVLCEGLSHEAALRQAERLRAAVPAAFDGDLGFSPTVSIGLATFPDDGEDLLGIVRHADLNLYRAKNSGRDRIVGNNPLDRRG